MRPAGRIVVSSLCALVLGSCGGGRGDEPAPTAAPASATTSTAPGVAERNFTAWLEHGGHDEAYAAWSRGEFGPPTVTSDASIAERREAFTTWLEAPVHRAMVARAWLRAERRGAQARLRDALAAAQVYAIEHADTFEGLGIGAMERIDPGLRYGVGPSRFGVITLREISPASILLITGTPDGEAVCISLNNGGDVGYGWLDATTYAACVGERW